MNTLPVAMEKAYKTGKAALIRKSKDDSFHIYQVE
jgi:hypothetical protein